MVFYELFPAIRYIFLGRIFSFEFNYFRLPKKDAAAIRARGIDL